MITTRSGIDHDAARVTRDAACITSAFRWPIVERRAGGAAAPGVLVAVQCLWNALTEARV